MVISIRVVHSASLVRCGFVDYAFFQLLNSSFQKLPATPGITYFMMILISAAHSVSFSAKSTKKALCRLSHSKT